MNNRSRSSLTVDERLSTVTHGQFATRRRRSEGSEVTKVPQASGPADGLAPMTERPPHRSESAAHPGVDRARPVDQSSRSRRLPCHGPLQITQLLPDGGG